MNRLMLSLPNYVLFGIYLADLLVCKMQLVKGEGHAK